MICCSNADDHEILKSLRAHGWSRGLKNEKKIAKKFYNLDKRFIFYNSGFNLRSTDIAASIGLSQFKDLDKFIKLRSYNRDKIYYEIQKNKKVKKRYNILKPNNFVKASWFGIPVILHKSLDRNKVIRNLERMGIETRPIISGNFLKQPSVIKYKLNKKGKMKNAEQINNRGFFIGLPTNKMTSKKIKKLINYFLKNF